jgi:hypothetical protein
MALKRYDVIIHSTSGLARDDSINSLYFEVNAPDTVGGNADELAAAWTSNTGLFTPAANGITIKVYDWPAGGSPIFSKNYAFVGNGSAGPSEVACCLSYSAVDAAAGPPRGRGRIYIGPFNSGAERPSSFQRTAVLAMGQAIAAVGTASNTTWKLWSRTQQAAAKVESISVDDAWDIQRRRGLKPTLRTRQDVQ